ncbi:hypothetical protein B4U80_05808 [Leptotrombidium deliense]|uniref:Cyanate hydratase n=1 Tax=Leptotrombidium deliense TaxID=299467 RepID=A0A443S759_9ACAR|nr:hypothetical protein B4U80_05808 [Leptotrombidium deliense]
MANVTRKDVTDLLLAFKRRKQITFTELADKLGRNKVWTTAAILGQHPMSETEATTVLRELDMNEKSITNLDDVKRILMECPLRGNYPWPPSDPTLYRLYEITQIYGPSIKAVAHELCGDGIISGINCKIDVNKQLVDGDDWVEIKILGKFLRYPNE